MTPSIVSRSLDEAQPVEQEVAWNLDAVSSRCGSPACCR